MPSLLFFSVTTYIPLMCRNKEKTLLGPFHTPKLFVGKYFLKRTHLFWRKKYFVQIKRNMWSNLKCQKKLFAFFLLEVSLYVIVQKAITTPYPYRRGVFLGGWGKRVREHKRKALYCWAGDIMEGHTGRLPHICVQRSQRKDHNNQTTRPRHWAGIFNLIHSSVSNYSSLNKGIRTNTFQKGASLTWLINWLTYKAHQITKHGCDLVEHIWHHFGRVININDMVSGVLISRTLFRRVIDINDMVLGVLDF